MGLVDEEELAFKSQLKILISKASGIVPNVVQEENTIIKEDNTLNQNNQTVETTIPAVGPGLPGYVAPQQPTIQSSDAVISTPTQNNQPVEPIQFAGYQFDKKGTVISSPSQPATDGSIAS